MVNRFNFLFAVLVLFSISCSKKQNKPTIPTLTVDIETVLQGKASDFFESIEYVWLDDETNPVGAFGDFHRLIKHEDKYFIFDEDNCKCFYIFSSKGEFILKVMGYGEGPESYIYPSSFQIVGNKLQLNDIYLKKILEYDFSGDWIGDAEQRFPADEVFIGEDGRKFYRSMPYLLEEDKNQVRVFDSEGNLIYKGFPSDERFERIKVKNRNPFIPIKEGVLLIDDYVDTVFILKDSSASPYLAFDFKGKGLKQGDFDKVQQLETLELLNFMNKTMPIRFDGRAVANDRYFLGSFKNEGKVYMGIYDFKEDKGFVYSSVLTNDIDLGKDIFQPFPLDKETVYVTTTGIDLYKHVQSLKKKMSTTEWDNFVETKGKRLVQTALKAKDSENRILVLMKWKK